MMTKEKILQAITESGDKGIYADSLMRDLNIDGAALRKYIRVLRREGIPIASGSYGYKLADNYELIKKTVQSLECRALSMIRTANKLKQCFNIQPTLFENMSKI